MKNIIIGLILALSSLSSFAQASNALLEKLSQTGALCNSQEFMLDFALDSIRQSPSNESYKRELAGAKVDLARCKSNAAANLQADCKSTIKVLLEKNILCSAEKAMLEAADVMYKMDPSSRNARELADAKGNSVHCATKTNAVCLNR